MKDIIKARNRTNVELKLDLNRIKDLKERARNRTNVELKLRCLPVVHDHRLARNRTNVELKPLDALPSGFYVSLAIAPMWN